jgi:ATP-binding cassette subfamily B protein
MHPIRKLLHYGCKYKLAIYIASLYSLLNKVFDILPEVLIGVAVDVIVKQQDSIVARFGIHNVIAQIVVLGITTGFIWMFESLFQYLYSLKWCFLAQNLQHDLRIDAYSHVQKLQLAYFENKAMGNTMAILNDDVNQLERFLNDGVNQIIQIAASTILIALIFFSISPRIALLSFLPIPLILLGSFYFRKKLAPHYLKVRHQAGLVNSKLNNNLAGIATIKSFTTEQYEVTQVANLSNQYRDANKAAIVLSAAITPVIRMAVMVGFLVALIYGGILTLDGKIAISSYSILIFLSQRLLWPLTYLAGVIDTYQRAMAAANRVLDLINTPILIADGLLELPKSAPGHIKFDKVSFGYTGRKNMFQHLSFEVNPGQTIAFVGSTGSGKSTLVKLLLRFYEVKSGQILIDNLDINQLKLASLRSNIGLVSQETFLIDGTIAENIAYGSFSASMEQIITVAKITDADWFINQLPQGYHTSIGERGQKLSGGQRQRIALARAILKDPAILILDEATSALDNQTESIIQQALDKVVKGRTTIVIAHRLSTIVNADKIHVLQHGKIVEAGNHETLLRNNGLYANLWRLQLREGSI